MTAIAKPQSIARRLAFRLVAVFSLSPILAIVLYALYSNELHGDATSLQTWIEHEVVSEYLPLLFFLVMITVPAALLSIRSSLLPVKRLAEAAAAVGTMSHDAVLPLDDVPAELLPLVQAINRGLQRIDDQFEHQRRFTANAAHELRTPLAALQARIDGLSDAASRDELQGGVQRLARVVEQLLAVARLQRQVTSGNTDVDLGAIAREAIRQAAPIAIAAGKQLELIAPKEGPTVRGDFSGLVGAVRNLVDNAVRHSPPSGVVSIRVDPNGPTIDVADQGRGIAPDDREHIFEPFWRGEGGGGAGLGLAIVSETMELHRGRVVLRANEPCGSVFRLDFTPPTVMRHGGDKSSCGVSSAPELSQR